MHPCIYVPEQLIMHKWLCMKSCADNFLHIFFRNSHTINTHPCIYVPEQLIMHNSAQLPNQYVSNAGKRSHEQFSFVLEING